MTNGESGREWQRVLMVEERTMDAIDAAYVKVNHCDDADSLGVCYEIGLYGPTAT